MKSQALGAALLLAAAAASAQSRRPAESPEVTASAVLRADSIRDWRMLLALAHPAALLEYRRDKIKSLSFEGFGGFPQADPCLAKELQRYNQVLLDSVFRVPSVDSLTKMVPESVFAREQRYWSKLPQIPDTLRPDRSIVGHVVADDSTAYVIIEEKYTHRPLPEWPERRPQIMTFRRYRDAWRSMLDPDIGNRMNALMIEGDACR